VTWKTPSLGRFHQGSVGTHAVNHATANSEDRLARHALAGLVAQTDALLSNARANKISASSRPIKRDAANAVGRFGATASTHPARCLRLRRMYALLSPKFYVATTVTAASTCTAAGGTGSSPPSFELPHSKYA